MGPPGVADVLGGFCQQEPPAPGYSLTAFDQRIVALASEQQRLVAAGDARAVFHLVYLSFSRQVRRGFELGRFSDPSFAADMSCRFIDAYLEQARRFDAGDPSQCTAWRKAFGQAASGDANVLQAMLLGMNAHIHYDLAFVTLGSCKAAGDLPEVQGGGWRSLSMTGVPAVRHLDFLVINQIAWESLGSIREAVLSQFSLPLKLGGQLAARFTDAVGQRILMDARDSAWRHTTLLIHAADERQRTAVGALVEAYSAHHTDLIDGLSANPRNLLDGFDRWASRGEHPQWADGMATPQTTRDVLVDMARTTPVVRDLALHDLAFAGYDPVPIVARLGAHAAMEVAADYVGAVHRHGTRRSRQALETWLVEGPPDTVRVVTSALVNGALAPADLSRELRKRVQAAWEASLVEGVQCLALREVRAVPGLVEALEAHDTSLRALADRAGIRLRPDGTPPSIGRPAARAALARHLDLWVRMLAHRLDDDGDPRMNEAIDRVLFLRSTHIFKEVATEALIPVADDLRLSRFEPGQLLVREGEHADGIHLIRSGRVEVLQNRRRGLVPLFSFGPGNSVGELSAFTDEPSVVTCRATEPTETWLLPTELLAHLLNHHPRMAIGLLRILSQRLAMTTQIVSVPSRGTDRAGA